MKLTRRDALKGLGAAALAPLSSACGDELILPARVQERIDTVVVLMMENRGFDHTFGALSLVEGRRDVDGLRPGMTNPRRDGTPLASLRADAFCIADAPHGLGASHEGCSSYAPAWPQPHRAPKLADPHERVTPRRRRGCRCL